MRSRAAVGAVVLLGAAAPVSAEPAMTVTASCERKPAKGRVTCEVELEAVGRIAWADVLVTAAPSFAPPLRSRVSMAEARVRTDKRVRIPVSLVATATGRGTVEMRGRATVCERPEGAGETCRPVSSAVTAELVVGTDVER
jgi:hypothetical protein